MRSRENKVELRLILNSVTVFHNWFDIFQTLTTFEKLLILATVADYLHGSKVNPNTPGLVWTVEFDMTQVSVDAETFVYGKKSFRIQKFPGWCGRGLKVQAFSYRSEVCLMCRLASFFGLTGKTFKIQQNQFRMGARHAEQKVHKKSVLSCTIFW